MPEMKLMTLDERCALRMKAIELEDHGKMKEAKKVAESDTDAALFG